MKRRSIRWLVAVTVVAALAASVPTLINAYLIYRFCRGDMQPVPRPHFMSERVLLFREPNDGDSNTRLFALTHHRLFAVGSSDQLIGLVRLRNVQEANDLLAFCEAESISLGQPNRLWRPISPGTPHWRTFPKRPQNMTRNAGILTPTEWKRYHLSPPTMTAGGGHFVITRWVCSEEEGREADPMAPPKRAKAYLVRHWISPDGTVAEEVLLCRDLAGGGVRRVSLA